MATIVSAKQPDEPDREPAHANLFFNDKDAAVEGLENIGLGKSVTVTLTGKIKSLSDSDWSEGVSVDIRPTNVKIETSDQEISLDDAIVAAEKKI